MKSYLYCKDIVSLNEQQTVAFLQCLFAETKNEPITLNIDNEGVSNSILYKRLLWSGSQIKVSVPLAYFIGYLSEGSSEEIEMWAYTLNRMYVKNPKKVFTMEDWGIQFFSKEKNAYCIPSPKERFEIWNEQKITEKQWPGNGIDRIENWQIN